MKGIRKRKKGQGRVQRHSQNLKEVFQNFTELFDTDDVTANDVIQRNQHRNEKNNKLQFQNNH